MRNAKEELLSHIGHFERKLKAAHVYGEKVIRSVGQDGKRGRNRYVKFSPFYLFPDHSEQELTDFLSSLDFEYDSGYGTQELFGTLWFDDGTWSDRFEYDGSERWEHHELPPVPDREEVRQYLAQRKKQEEEEDEEGEEEMNE